MRISLGVVLAAVVAGACGDDDGDEVGECTPEVDKAWALDVARGWYLYPDLLPETVSLAAYPDVPRLMEALTARARAENKDRGFTYVTSVTELNAVRQGAAVGFGYRSGLRGDQLFVADVYEGSAAAEAGFVRGDEILAIGVTAGALTPVAQLIAEQRLNQALGPNEPGVARVFEVKTSGGVVTRTVAKRGYTVDPVPRFEVIRREGQAPVGYIQLRTFSITEAASKLDAAFAAFASESVTDVILDVRYNGGGALSLAEQLANHMGAALTGMPMYTLRHNPNQSSSDRQAAFAARDNRLAATRVAFITSGSSASASELVPNVLEPYVPVALAGARTFGKPVGQFSFEREGCETVVVLLAFQLFNRDGDGHYFEGLPDERFSGPLCDAPDDLTRAQGDPLEARTKAALDWLATGSCPAAKLATPDDVPLMPESPTLWQREVPGMF